MGEKRWALCESELDHNSVLSDERGFYLDADNPRVEQVEVRTPGTVEVPMETLRLVTTPTTPPAKAVAVLGELRALLPQEPELLPCPFCGGKAELRGSESEETAVVECQSCYCDTQLCSSNEEARRLWSRRAPVGESEPTCLYFDGSLENPRLCKNPLPCVEHDLPRCEHGTLVWRQGMRGGCQLSCPNMDGTCRYTPERPTKREALKAALKLLGRTP